MTQIRVTPEMKQAISNRTSIEDLVRIDPAEGRSRTAEMIYLVDSKGRMVPHEEMIGDRDLAIHCGGEED